MLITFVTLAKLMDKDGLMAKFGRQTLLFCCLEIVYLFCRIALQKLTGIQMIPKSPLDGLVFAFIQILFCYFLLIPVFTKFVPFFCGIGRRPGTPGPAGKGA